MVPGQFLGQQRVLGHPSPPVGSLLTAPWGTLGCLHHRPAAGTLVPALASMQPRSPASASSGPLALGAPSLVATRAALSLSPSSTPSASPRREAARKVPASVLGTCLASQPDKTRGTAGSRPRSSSSSLPLLRPLPPAGQGTGVEIELPKFSRAKTRPRTTSAGCGGRGCTAQGGR